jgi:hypothetical protein
MKTPKYTDLHRYPNGYRKSTETDVTGTFRRIRREQEQARKETEAKVKPIQRRTA